MVRLPPEWELFLENDLNLTLFYILNNNIYIEKLCE